MPSYEAVTFTPTVPTALATSSRSSLDLLHLPYPFSQVPLLTASDMLDAAKIRRITMAGDWDLTIDGLQELHRYRILVPMYCVRLTNARVPEPSLNLTKSLTAQHCHTTIPQALYRAAVEGRLSDPATVPFRSWPTRRKQTAWPTVERAYLYSQHQLIGLRRARGFVSSLRPYKGPDRRGVWRLDPAAQPSPEARTALASPGPRGARAGPSSVPGREERT
ncbi:hypothetical protein SAMN05892883_2837 [Jatrophihabitans sp. GAS493]|nr:hypothetical protein SAMN05892883_2837 [Jatrophihabitans sp. GAS493]